MVKNRDLTLMEAIRLPNSVAVNRELKSGPNENPLRIVRGASGEQAPTISHRGNQQRLLAKEP